MWMREVFFIIKAYLLPEGFFTLSVRLVWGGQWDVLVLLFEHSFCQVIVVEQSRCIVEGLKPKTGYESACCSYSEWRGQSAQGHCSTAREQRTAHPLGPSERPAARSPSEKRRLASHNANCYNSPLPMHAWGVMRDSACGARHVCKHTNTSVHVLSQSSHILFTVIQRRNTPPPHIPPCLIFSYRFHQALSTWHVLQIHKGVGEEFGKGDPGIWISLQQPQQKVSAVLGDSGPWRELMHKTWPYNVALHQQDNPREKDSIFTIFTSLLFIKRWS